MAKRFASGVPILFALPLLLAGAASAAPSETLRLLTALGLLLGLGAAALRISRWLLPEVSGASRLTSTFVFGAAMVVVPATALGHFGFLEPRLFLVVEALLVAATLALRHRPRAAESAPPEDEGNPPWVRRGEAALLALAGAAALLGISSIALRAELDQPPSKLDDASYHLPAVAVWNRYHDLRMIKLGAGDVSPTFYPIGGELIDWALLAPLRDSDFLLRWSQLPFALASLGAIAAIAGRLGLSRRTALVSALLYLTVHRAFPALLFSAGNDHALAFYSLAAIDAALVYGKAKSAGSALYAGLAFGLLVGTKYIGALYAVPLLVLLIVAAGWRIRLSHCVVFCLSAVAVGGYTYLRNAWTVGNPFFPAPFSFLGLSLPGWSEVTLAVRRHYPDFELDLRQFLLVRTDQLGSCFRFTMLPAAVGAPVISLLRREGWRQKAVRTLVLLLPWIFFLEFLFLMHDHRDIRYFFAAVALACAACGWLLQVMAANRPLALAWLRGGLACLIALDWFLRGSAISRSRGTVTAWLLVALVMSGLALGARFRPWLAERRTALVGLACGVALLAVSGLAGTLRRYQERKYRHDAVVGFLDQHGGDGGVTLAYAGSNQPYPLFGSRLQHRVEIVPLKGALEDRYYAWGGSGRIHNETGSYRRWRRNLQRLGIQFVVIALGDAQEPERRWVSAHPEDFERVFALADSEVWRFKGGLGT